MKKFILLFLLIPSLLFAQDIIYPPEINTNYKKLCVVYSLLEQMRLEHNRVGTIARSDWKANQGKWAEYAKIFSAKQLSLLQEQNRLKEAILVKSSYKWSDIAQSDTIYKLLFGDKVILSKLSTTATSLIVDQLKAIDFFSLRGQFVDPTENFTTYTLQDSGSDATVLAASVTLDTMQQVANMYIYKDAGAAHFGDFSHLYDWQVTASNDEIYFGLYAIGNSFGTITDQYAGNNTLAVFCYVWNVAPDRCRIRVHDFSDDSIDTFDLQSFSQFWNTTARSGTTFTNSVYSNSDRTTLVDAQSTPCPNTTLQYVQGPFSHEVAGTLTVSLYMQNLDLQEIIPSLIVSPDATVYIDSAYIQ